MDKWVENSFWKTIGWLERIFQWSDLLCRMYYTWRQIVFVWDMIKIVFSGAELAASGYPPAEKTIEKGRQTVCKTEEAAHAGAGKFGEYADKYCAFINCKHAPLPEGKKVKGQEYWNALGGGGAGATWINTHFPTIAGKKPLGEPEEKKEEVKEEKPKKKKPKEKEKKKS